MSPVCVFFFWGGGAANNCPNSHFRSAWKCSPNFLLLYAVLTLTFSSCTSPLQYSRSRFFSEFCMEQNVRYSRKLLEIFPYLLHATIISCPSCEFILGKVCKPKTSVLLYTGTNFSTCGARQILLHPISNNTPQWLLMPCTMLQETSEILGWTR